MDVMSNTFGYSFRVGFVVAVHIGDDPDPAVWRSYLRTLQDNPIKGALVWWEDWAPDQEHRIAITDFASPGIPVAVVSYRESTIWELRALDIYLEGVRQFQPRQLQEAFQFLQIEPSLEPLIRRGMKEAGWPAAHLGV